VATATAKGKKTEAVVAEPTAELDEELVVETDDDDGLEALDEIEAAAVAVETAGGSEAEAAKPKRKKAKQKKEQPVRQGMTTKEAAAALDITPQRLRRILRSEDGGFQDNDYTRYDLTPDTIERIRNLIQSGAAEKRTRKEKKTKGEATDETTEEVAEELASLEDDADADEDEELDLGEEEEDEDEE
jgi:hypothetical protein